MDTKFLKWKIPLIVFILLILSIHPGLVYAQDGCDPATGQQCDVTPAPTCGLPGLPSCDGGGGSGSDGGSNTNLEPKPKPTKTSPPPVITRTFTPTATNTLTNTPEPSPTSTNQPAPLPPRSTLPSVTLTEQVVTLVPRPTSTASTRSLLLFPINLGGSGDGSGVGKLLPFGIIGALIVIGILWAVRTRYFADGSVRKNRSAQPGRIPRSPLGVETARAGRYQEAIRMWIREGWNQGNFEVVERLFDPNFHLKDFSYSDTRPYTGHARLKRYVLRFRNAFPDLQMTDDDVFVAGSRVVWRFVATGTHMGRFLGLHPTGKSVKVKGVAIFEFSGDVVQECGSYWNSYNLIHQIADNLNPQEILSAMQKFR